MSLAPAALATLLLTNSALAQQSGPPASTPLRNTFVTATESVLDQEASLDLNADATAFGSGMATLKTGEQNLTDLAADDQEAAILSAVKNLHFTLASCRIQAVDGTDISQCLVRLDTHRTEIMRLIHKHKEGGVWADGDPKP